MADTTSRADRVLRVGAAITALGLIFTLIAVAPLLFPSLGTPSALWFLSMLTGVGIAVIGVGLAMSARSRRVP
ncbi:MAG: hypothetical protein IPO93_01975 [Actinobacteria bacterium]|jgi:hypothetical protein|nr:hypothetical protein [Actinomycetota bacterium]